MVRMSTAILQSPGSSAGRFSRHHIRQAGRPVPRWVCTARRHALVSVCRGTRSPKTPRSPLSHLTPRVRIAASPKTARLSAHSLPCRIIGERSGQHHTSERGRQFVPRDLLFTKRLFAHADPRSGRPKACATYNPRLRETLHHRSSGCQPRSAFRSTRGSSARVRFAL